MAAASLTIRALTCRGRIEENLRGFVIEALRGEREGYLPKVKVLVLIESRTGASFVTTNMMSSMTATCDYMEVQSYIAAALRLAQT